MTGVPGQTWFDGFTVMATFTGKLGLTAFVMVLESAGLPVAQVASEVISQVIWSPLPGAKEKTGEFVPLSNPLTLHWYAGDGPPLT